MQPNILQVLTPQALQMLETIHRTGSFSKAAHELGLVPSAMTYRVRQIEDTLDVLLFDRSSRQAKITASGSELLNEGLRILGELGALANRVKRIASGWEPYFNIVVDDLIDTNIIFDICNKFFDYNAHMQANKNATSTTKISITTGTLKGTFEHLVTGEADLAIGINQSDQTKPDGINTQLLGKIEMVQVVSCNHELAQIKQVTDEQLKQYRVIVVRDSARILEPITIGYVYGQNTLKVSNIRDKLQAQLAGLGFGYLPLSLAKPYLTNGALVEVNRAKSRTEQPFYLSWRANKNNRPEKVLNWWLEQLNNEITQKSLLKTND